MALWLLNGLNIAAARVLAMVPLEWQLIGVSDINGDGQADLVWRNTTTGDVALWLLNGLNIAAARVLATVPLEWQLVGDGQAEPY